ncbi:MAG: CBM20 domain-containing protein, partial [Leeuwenhoekiella sp.]
MKRIFILFLVLSNSLRVSAQENTNVKFSVNATSLENVKSLGIRGSVSPLSWNKTYYLKDADVNGVYEAEIVFSTDVNEVVEYKYVHGGKSPVWELDGQNRILLLDSNEIQLNDEWNVPGKIDVKRLPKLSAEKLTDDFNILKMALLEVHPGLHRYRSETEMDSIFNRFQQVFSQPLSYQEAFLNFTKLTAAIQ